MLAVPCNVMAGLVPAIHVLLGQQRKTWMPGTRPGMTNERAREMADMWNKYEPTAARKRGKPGRDTRPKSTTIDMHAHVAIPRAAEIAGSHVDPKTVPLDHFSTPETKALMAKQGADIAQGIRPTDVRFKT